MVVGIWNAIWEIWRVWCSIPQNDCLWNPNFCSSDVDTHVRAKSSATVSVGYKGGFSSLYCIEEDSSCINCEGYCIRENKESKRWHYDGGRVSSYRIYHSLSGNTLLSLDIFLLNFPWVYFFFLNFWLFSDTVKAASGNGLARRNRSGCWFYMVLEMAVWGRNELQVSQYRRFSVVPVVSYSKLRLRVCFVSCFPLSEKKGSKTSWLWTLPSRSKRAEILEIGMQLSFSLCFSFKRSIFSEQ